MIDAIMPTAQIHLDGAICQVKTATNQDCPVRVTIATATPFKKPDAFSPSELARIRFVEGVPQGNWGHPAVGYCLENLEMGDWIYPMGDDDCLLPWGLKHLYEATRSDLSMVIGTALSVYKDNHIHRPDRSLGYRFARGYITGSCALLNYNMIKKLEKPWWAANDYGADWLLMERLSKIAPYVQLPNTVCMFAIDG